MSVWDRTAGEPQRHALARVMTPDTFSVSNYFEALKDPSWRVRKAALLRASHFLPVPGFVDELIHSLASEDDAGLRNAAAEALSSLGREIVPALVGRLEKANRDERKFIVEALGTVGSAEATSELGHVLDDSDINVRAAAAEALGRIGGEEVAARLLEALDQAVSDPQTAAYVLDALARVNSSVSFDRLRPYLEQPVLKRSVYRLLGRSGDDEAASVLVAGITQGSRGNRAAALCALAQLMSDVNASPLSTQEVAESVAFAESLVAFLEDDDASDEVVAAASRAAAVCGHCELAPVILCGCSRRSNLKVGVEAVLKLGPKAVPHLLEALPRVDVESRILFLESIELLGDESHALEIFDRVLPGEKRTVEAALRAVGRIGGQEAIAPLLAWVDRLDLDVEFQIASALLDLGRRFPEAVRSRARQCIADGDIRARWLNVLGALGDCEDILTLRWAANHKQASVRQAALDASALVGEGFPTDVVILALTDEAAPVRRAAARALGNKSDEQTLEALLGASHDTDPAVSAEALRSLGAVGGDCAVARLEESLMSDESLRVLAALKALFLLNPPGLARMIGPVFAHRDPEVVREAVETSGRLCEEKARPLLLRCVEHPSWSVRRASLDMLLNRGIAIPDDILARRFEEESEPFVRESLERFGRRGFA